MRRMVRVFAGRTSLIAGFIVRWLILYFKTDAMVLKASHFEDNNMLCYMKKGLLLYVGSEGICSLFKVFTANLQQNQSIHKYLIFFIFLDRQA